MREVEPAHRRGRRHRTGLGQLHADAPRAEQVEEPALLGVIGARGIAERRPDAAILLGDQIVVRELLGAAVAEITPRLRVQVLGKRLGQPIGQRLDDDGGVVVVLGLEAADEVVDAVARR